MDLGTIIGSLVTAGLLIGSILTGSGLAAFLDVPSIMIVIGGTFGVGFMTYPMKRMFGAAKVAMQTIIETKYDSKGQKEKLLALADSARKEGILALEGEVDSVEEPLMKRGLQLLVDGVEPEMIETILWDEVDATSQRHTAGAKVFQSLATIAPSLGLIGTLIGLVAMLQNMNDPSNIGPAMAVALLTTFYGALLANVVFSPIAGKLEYRAMEERDAKTAMIRGLLGIANGVNPRILKQHLDGDLPKSEREAA